MNEVQQKTMYNEEDTIYIDQEGNILMNRLPKKVKFTPEFAKKLAEVGSELLTEIESALSRAHLKGIKSIIIQGENGKSCVLPSEKGKFFITTVGNIQ